MSRWILLTFEINIFIILQITLKNKNLNFFLLFLTLFLNMEVKFCLIFKYCYLLALPIDYMYSFHRNVFHIIIILMLQRRFILSSCIIYGIVLITKKEYVFNLYFLLSVLLK